MSKYDHKPLSFRTTLSLRLQDHHPQTMFQAFETADHKFMSRLLCKYKALCYHKKKESLFISNKTNQITQINFKGKDSRPGRNTKT